VNVMDENERALYIISVAAELAGVKRILELEVELEEAEAEIERLRELVRRARQEIAEAEERVHRKYRRDLVPVSNAIVHVRRRR